MKPGDKVVCVDDQFFNDAANHFSDLPVLGRVYVIRGIISRLGRIGVHLIGITGDWNSYFGCESTFKNIRFRKLDEMRAESAAKKKRKEPAGV